MNNKTASHRIPAKLKLEAETLKHLSADVLDGVVGGVNANPPELTQKEPSWCVCGTLR